ncbi:hypothetical protein HHK36_030749 [Tetracentron sinense]|uniref:Uncharacterized protein n=1 Tax=Tetracentron sinense TaxID=13715 RepID=A0A834YC89_TETSI|nr:hypothetical protein HHK36_030749 [Tetracentron sinense]
METVLSTSFWKGVIYAMKITAPLVCVLRLVDGEKIPPMGYIYEAMDKAKEAIKEALGGQRNVRRYKLVWDIVDKRWNAQLHQPLHAAGYYLNPEFFYKNRQIGSCEEVIEEQYIEEADNDSDVGDDEIEDEALLHSLLDEDDE